MLFMIGTTVGPYDLKFSRITLARRGASDEITWDLQIPFTLPTEKVPVFPGWGRSQSGTEITNLAAPPEAAAALDGTSMGPMGPPGIPRPRAAFGVPKVRRSACPKAWCSFMDAYFLCFMSMDPWILGSMDPLIHG